MGRASRPPPSHTTGHTGHVSGGSANVVRVIRHPNRGVVSRGASRESIPGAGYDPTPRRMSSYRSTSGHDSYPPFRPSARSCVPTMPSAKVKLKQAKFHGEWNYTIMPILSSK
jgi:hypothetical protein